jgi:prophage regulatory protein
MPDRIIRENEVFARTGRSRVSIWRAERLNEFPRRRKIGPRSIGWLESEIENWLATRPLANIPCVQPGVGQPAP